MSGKIEGTPELFREAAEALSAAAEEGRDLETALLGVHGAEGVLKLSSRQGSCFEIRISGSKGIFAKLLSDNASAKREEEFSKLVSEAGVSCPRVEARRRRAIARAYIEGRPASEELDAMKGWGDAQAASKLCRRIGAMLASVHEVAAADGRLVTLEDANLRNFIVSSSNALSVIDLADAAFGDQAQDLGGLIVHILTHKPAFSQLSSQMAEAAIEGYSKQRKVSFKDSWLEDGLRSAFRKASIRRADECLLSYEDEAVSKLAAAKIRKRGERP